MTQSPAIYMQCGCAVRDWRSLQVTRSMNYISIQCLCDVISSSQHPTRQAQDGFTIGWLDYILCTMPSHLLSILHDRHRMDSPSDGSIIFPVQCHLIFSASCTAGTGWIPHRMARLYSLYNALISSRHAHWSLNLAWSTGMAAQSCFDAFLLHPVRFMIEW